MCVGLFCWLRVFKKYQSSTLQRKDIKMYPLWEAWGNSWVSCGPVSENLSFGKLLIVADVPFIQVSLSPKSFSKFRLVVVIYLSVYLCICHVCFLFTWSRMLLQLEGINFLQSIVCFAD